MKEIKYILGKKQADESIIFVKGISGEEIEKAFNYYDALDYKSLAYARATRNVFEKLQDYDVYKVFLEINNAEPEREKSREIEKNNTEEINDEIN